MFRCLPLLALAWSLGAAAVAPPGLLLGRLSANESRYQTVWIYDDDGRQIRILVVPDLLLPRQNGFWRIGSYRTLETSEEYAPLSTEQGEKYTIEQSGIGAVPSRQTPSITLAPNQEVITGDADSPCEHTDRDISFINPTHIWYRVSSGFECGVHPGASTELYAARIESRSTRLGIAQMLGPSGLQAYSQGVAAAFAEAKEAGSECQPREDPRDWSVERGQGKWKVTGWATTHRLCGYGLDLEIPIALPPSITGYDRLPKPWTMRAAEIPGLLDAFSSPANRLLVAVTRDAILVYRPDGPKIGPPVLRYPFKWDVDRYETDTVVMAQWAVGPRPVALWTKEVESTREIRPLVRQLKRFT